MKSNATASVRKGLRIGRMRTANTTLVLLVVVNLAFSVASAQEDVDVPVLADTSSPRATLKSFIDSCNDFYQVTKADRHFDRRSPYHRPRVRRVLDCLDTSELPNYAGDEIASEAAACLKEMLDRVALPPFEEIPDIAAIEAAGGPEELFRWHIPGTHVASPSVFPTRPVFRIAVARLSLCGRAPCRPVAVQTVTSTPREHPARFSKCFPISRMTQDMANFPVIPTIPFPATPSGLGICVTTVICVTPWEMDRVLRHGPRRLRHGNGICVTGCRPSCIDLHLFAHVRAACDGRDANDATSGRHPLWSDQVAYTLTLAGLPPSHVRFFQGTEVADWGRARRMSPRPTIAHFGGRRWRRLWNQGRILGLTR